MWNALLLAALLVPQQQGGGRGGAVGGIMAGPGSVQISLELTLAAPVQAPDGRMFGASMRIPSAPSTDPWFVYSRGHLCDSVITRGAVPVEATDGWRISIVERSRTNPQTRTEPAQMVVGVTWFRMWERGRLMTAGSGGTSELTLRSGDRIPLDQITRPSATADCAGTQKTLELQVTSRVTPPAGMVSPGAPPATPEPNAPLDKPVEAELWMVHQLPNGTETVQHQRVRLPEGGVGFLFRGVPVDTTDGPITVEVTGQLRAVLRADRTRGMWAGFTRSVAHQPTGRLLSRGSGGDKTVEWLASDDVFSFDLPPLAIYAGQATAGGGGGGGGALVARGSGGVATGATAGGTGGVSARTMVAAPAQRGPNLLEGHKLSVRIKLIESK